MNNRLFLAYVPLVGCKLHDDKNLVFLVYNYIPSDNNLPMA